MRRLPSLVLTLGLALWARPARASYVVENFCFRHAIGFDDQSSALGDDYLTTETSIPAYGAEAKVTRSDGTVFFDGWLSDASSGGGCTGNITLNNAYTYTLQIKSKSQVQGNTLASYDDDATPALAITVWGTVSVSGGTLTRTTSLTRQWSNLAAMSWAMFRRTAGLSGATLNAYNQDCPSGPSGSSCCDDEELYVPNNRKYQIVSTMGACIAEKRNEGLPANGPTGMAEAPCEGVTGASHELISKEVNKTSAWFGFAHYYAAAAFNQTDQTDCKFYYWFDLDWNRDGTADDSQWRRVDCDAGMSTWSVDSYNYVEDYCESGTWDHKTNVGTEYDWLRFFWDLDAVEGLSTTNIATIVDEADMDSCDDSLAYTHADACANRLGTAAVDNGWFWDQYFVQIGAGHDFVTGS